MHTTIRQRPLTIISVHLFFYTFGPLKCKLLSNERVDIPAYHPPYNETALYFSLLSCTYYTLLRLSILCYGAVISFIVVSNQTIFSEVCEDFLLLVLLSEL